MSPVAAFDDELLPRYIEELQRAERCDEYARVWRQRADVHMARAKRLLYDSQSSA